MSGELEQGGNKEAAVARAGQGSGDLVKIREVNSVATFGG